MRGLTKRRNTVAGLLAVGALMLAGCQQSDADVDWTEPSWVAEQRAEQEEYMTSLQSCVEGRGWNVTITPEGGVEEPFDNDEVDDWEEDKFACLESLGYDAEPTYDEERIRLLYSRLIDTRECLVTHGHDLPAPQDEETYVENTLRLMQEGDAGGDIWHPYNHDSFHELDREELEELEAQCPQPWFAS
ncbi:MAG TPA: hypothetical protein VK095_14205 [Beutenbergiaceae bacterium]|nr:hypothetical protein [Beutenbergiaceae bacterium]